MSPLRIKENIGWLFVIILSLIPIAIWYSMVPLNVRFSNLSVSLRSFGQVAGLVGMAMFSMTLVLNTRLKVFEDYFGGLNKVYIAHHIFGAIAFILLMFHPLFLAGRFLLVSVRSATSFLLPSANWPINFGMFALLSMMVLLILTLFVKLSYNRWLPTHKFLGGAFFLASLHIFLIPSDISRSLPLRYYMLSLAALGLAAYSYKTLFGSKFIKKFEYDVDSIKEVGKNVFEIKMTPLKRRMKFVPGQFVFVSFHGSGVSKEVHPFSISSSPDDDRLGLTIKVLGDYTSKLNNLKKGTVAKVEGPYGRFSHKIIGNKRQIWVAGGIGITPFLSMARSLKDEGYSIDLYYCVKNKDELIFSNELSKISTKGESLRMVTFCSDDKGHITGEFIKETSKGLSGKDILICGPPGMMKALKKQFIELGVKKRYIHSEEFELL
ncbi:hypothetical protein A3K63_05710 [Candidatus Micrarchaeota archaeon RBG_16_49_10]|nr:MAG: hypothetical protein A3K63_05710 [Candidatus Micrarchaeota archaeon RBG_16_49_10]